MCSWIQKELTEPTNPSSRTCKGDRFCNFPYCKILTASKASTSDRFSSYTHCDWIFHRFWNLHRWHVFQLPPLSVNLSPLQNQPDCNFRHCKWTFRRFRDLHKWYYSRSLDFPIGSEHFTASKTLQRRQFLQLPHRRWAVNMRYRFQIAKSNTLCNFPHSWWPAHLHLSPNAREHFTVSKTSKGDRLCNFSHC